MKRRSLGNIMFDSCNVAFFLLLGALMIFPFLNVLTLSLEPEYIANQTGVIHLIPQKITFKAYYEVFNYPALSHAFFNSVFVTVVGAIVGVVFTGMIAYGLSDEKMMGQKLISYTILFTMMFGGGIIPSFILVKKLGMINSLWSLIIPSMISAYNIILMRVFFKSLPSSLAESASIDGCSEIGIFFRVILPLSMPIIATISLFYAVGKWNSFFDAVMYISKPDKKTLQVILREILVQSNNVDAIGADIDLGTNVKMATAIVTIVPILLFYPYLQKYFTKGILLGAVKG